ncbi:site-specific integrase [Nocardia altamirensis]|uniref:site-specific integrase n=1 Tax=Nocardia altamirensis TaxID=472158 RepID=UPI0008403A0D|nr:site-specific integrase [Nocardia altamirensis]
MTMAQNTTRTSQRSRPAVGPLWQPLEVDQYRLVLEQIPPLWRALADHLVLSGARLGEVAALADTDIDPETGACRIERAWHRLADRWELVPLRSPRALYLPRNHLGQLDLRDSGEELFVIDGSCGPGLIIRFAGRIWRPAVAAVAERLGGQRPGVGVLRATCGVWMARAGVPLPVIAAHLGYSSVRAFVAVNPHVLVAADRAE